MNPADLQKLLERLIAEWEGEVVEFKEAGNDYDTDKIGRYFSALSNEANLRGYEQGWLIFGVKNSSRSVVGSDYRADNDRLNALKQQISSDTEPKLTFRNIYQLETPTGRVLLFEIPSAPRGIPISWKGHYYARAGESLAPLGLDKLDSIRAQAQEADWSAAVIPEASVSDLDPQAMSRARENFALKHANRFEKQEMALWSELTFLERARLTFRGGLTRTALLLLGRPEAAGFLSPHPAQMIWKLEGVEKAYQHFGPPFLLTSTELYQKIRNVQLRLLPGGELLAIEVAKYDQKIVLEALHNCIAHQDYNRNGRIVVTEYPDSLIFQSEGSFFEGQPLDYLTGEKTPRRYRNTFLTRAMVELNMIDTMGYGIHQMFIGQAHRYLPMPDYDLTEPESVKITLPGREVDPAYSRMLIQRTDLKITDILALDRIQKRMPVDNETLKHLKRAHLIEGRKPNLHVSAVIAGVTEKKAAYIKTRALDDGYYRELIIEFIRKFGHANRSNIDELLSEKLSDALNAKQKSNKITNLLTDMKRAGLIRNDGAKKASRWILSSNRGEIKNK